MQGLAVVGRSLELQTPLFRQRCSLDFTWPQRWLYFSCFGSRDPGGVQIGGWTSFFYIPDPEALLAEVLMDAWIRGVLRIHNWVADWPGWQCSKDSFSFGAISHLRTMGLLKGCRLLAAFFKIAKQRYSLHAEYQTRFILMGYEVNDIRQRLDFIAYFHLAHSCELCVCA
jgi:hypothetical protein